MSKQPDHRQLDLLDWTPPTADIVVHPAVYRAIWIGKVDTLAQRIVSQPSNASSMLRDLPKCLAEDLRSAGATDAETARQVHHFTQTLLAELARRRQGERVGPGAA